MCELRARHHSLFSSKMCRVGALFSQCAAQGSLFRAQEGDARRITHARSRITNVGLRQGTSTVAKNNARALCVLTVDRIRRHTAARGCLGHEHRAHVKLGERLGDEDLSVMNVAEDHHEGEPEAIGLIGHFEAEALLLRKHERGPFESSLDMGMSRRALVSTAAGIGVMKNIAPLGRPLTVGVTRQELPEPVLGSLEC